MHTNDVITHKFEHIAKQRDAGVIILLVIRVLFRLSNSIIPLEPIYDL